MTTPERVTVAGGVLSILGALGWFVVEATLLKAEVEQLNAAIARIEQQQELIRGDVSGHELQAVEVFARLEAMLER